MNEGKEERSTDWLEGWNESIATPAYVFDLDELKDRLQMIRRCLGNRIRLCYAMKANPFLVAPLQNFVDKYEVCSPGEFRICERHQVPMEQIVLSGVYKEDREICHAVETMEERNVHDRIETAVGDFRELCRRCGKEYPGAASGFKWKSIWNGRRIHCKSIGA